MGRKKNKGKQRGDARGYQTSNSSTAKSKSQQEPPQHLLSSNNASSSRLTAASTSAGASISTSNNNLHKKEIRITAGKHEVLERLIEDLKQLDEDEKEETARQQQQEATTTTTTAAASDRFYKRLVHVHDALVDVKFTEDQVTAVVRALGHDITLQSALDWLCLHVSTVELPALFTDGQVRDQQQQQQNNSNRDGTLTVLAATPARTSDEKDAENRHGQQQQLQGDSQERMHDDREDSNTKNAGDVNESDDDEDKEFLASQKARLLEQYQYVEEDCGDDDDQQRDNPEVVIVEKGSEQLSNTNDNKPMTGGVNDEEALLVKEGKKEEEVRIGKGTTPPPSTSSPDEARLEALEKELDETVADVKNEANNYMRSKQEIKQLEKRVQQLRKQVNKLRAKIERRKEEDNLQRAHQEQPSATSANEQEEECGFVDLFGDSNNEEEEEEGEAAAEATTAASVAKNPVVDTQTSRFDLVVPIDSIPSSWTGKTPRELLAEWCKKEKLEKPVYHHDQVGTHQRGCHRVRVVLRSNKQQQENRAEVEHPGPFGSHRDAQEYLATAALYKVFQSDIPLYRQLPPVYRALWQSWLVDKETAERDVAQQAKEQKHERIQELMRLCMERRNTKTATATAATTTTLASGTKKHNKTGATPDRQDKAMVQTSEKEVVPESWDDEIDAAAAAPMPKQKNAVRFISKRVREAFVRRTKSAAYQNMLEQRSALPICAHKKDILDTVQNNAVTIVCAETGAGKSTQCPQYLLEEALLVQGSSASSGGTSILCTQPRRVATISVAERVAQEMCEPAVGKLVGYQIRLETVSSADTRLLFCTTGVVLRRLVNDPTLNGVTHVVVDEVHERQWQMDVLLAALRNLIRGPRPDLKVILMSATLNAKLFSAFFGGAPLIHVSGRTFPVAQYYLEDLMEATGHMIEEDSKYALRRQHDKNQGGTLWVTTRGGEKKRETYSLDECKTDDDVSEDYVGYSISTRRSMDRVDETVINYDLIEDVLHLILIDDGSNAKKALQSPAEEGTDAQCFSEKGGAVLIFLPGMFEITTLSDRLKNSREFGNAKRFDIVPLHSTLSSTEQRRAFSIPPPGCRKIIVSTNIAETSVTIPDVVCIVDCGRMRELRNDKRTSTARLIVDWCSRASAKQRAGRAGRVQPGMCLKLFSSRTEQFVMKAASEPELRRVPLEEVCLTILAAGLAKSCSEFLGQTPEPPADAAVQSALTVLKQVGAVTLPPVVAWEDNQRSSGSSAEVLTPLGHHVAKLPVDVRVGKMLVFGAIFQCVDTVATVAACLSASQSLFASSIHSSQEAKAAHAALSHPQSDIFTLLRVWERFRKEERSGGGRGKGARKFCRDYFLNYSAFREVREAKRQYVDLLCRNGLLEREKAGYDQKRGVFDEQAMSSSLYNRNGNNEIVVHAISFAGLHPNIARLDTSAGGKQILLQKQEQLFVHSSSVNARLPTSPPSCWLTFHEKFGTAHRVSISTTCFVHPFSVILFGSSIQVLHTERKVIVDGWIELGMAAQVAVMLQNLRHQVDNSLKAMIERVRSNPSSSDRSTRVTKMVNGVVELLSQ